LKKRYRHELAARDPGAHRWISDGRCLVRARVFVGPMLALWVMTSSVVLVAPRASIVLLLQIGAAGLYKIPFRS